MLSIKQLLARLSVVVFGLGAAGEAAAADLATLDQATLAETLAAPELGGWSRADRARLLGIFATDTRPAVRVEVARRVAELPAPVPGAAMRILTRLAADESDEVADAVARALATVIDRAPAMRGASLLTKWALSPRDGQRRAAAAALERTIVPAIADTVLDHLAVDPSPAVRRAVARTAWARRAAAPALYDPILARLSEDPDRATRDVARTALGRDDLIRES
jgi:hypothetical protein